MYNSNTLDSFFRSRLTLLLISRLVECLRLRMMLWVSTTPPGLSWPVLWPLLRCLSLFWAEGMVLHLGLIMSTSLVSASIFNNHLNNQNNVIQLSYLHSSQLKYQLLITIWTNYDIFISNQSNNSVVDKPLWFSGRQSHVSDDDAMCGVWRDSN